ncbi:MAG: putative DNA modification/repair radical SAM protein [bacterium]|nr:putative DNA modification/repair radical SAM protein [bacterium]
MNLKDKLRLLGQVAEFDVCGYPRVFISHKRSGRFTFIYQAMGEGGSCVRLFKVLKTNECEGNCYYCANRKDRNYPRVSFAPNELAELFMEYYTQGLVEGCFLSSAIHKKPDESQEELIDTLRIIRKKYKYQGYIHTKILPETSKELIEKTAKYSDRISINIEAPGQNWLSQLSPNKNFARLLSKLREISELHTKKALKAGITTQFVVGGTKESDKSIINMAAKLYNEFKLWRVYYSGFIPVEDTPLRSNEPCPPLREFRLYQADSLIRKYKFKPNEIPFDEHGFLPKETDPKLAWAKLHPELFPIEINLAPLEKLIRVPGIGRISAERIIATRKEGKIKTLEALKKMGSVVSKARNFITLNGRQFPEGVNYGKETQQKQLFMWEEI